MLFDAEKFKNYLIYRPESISIPDTFPKRVRDFFATQEQNAHFIHKTELDRWFNNPHIPYLPCKVNFNLARLSKEILNFLENNENLFVQCPSAQRYEESFKWRGTQMIHNKEYDSKTIFARLTSNKFKELKYTLRTLHDLFGSGSEIIQVNFRQMLPGGYLFPHKDIYVENNPHLSVFYCPLDFTDQCYFKMQNVGLIPNQPVMLNNGDFKHSAINASLKNRTTMIVALSKEPKNIELDI